MRLPEIFQQRQPAISIEIFPPKSSQGDTALFASLATIAAVTADADATEQRCLADAVGALPADELDLLMLWAINPSAIDATGYLRFAQVSRSLAASCGLDLEMPTS